MRKAKVEVMGDTRELSWPQLCVCCGATPDTSISASVIFQDLSTT